MEVGIQLRVPNLGLSPNYGNMVKLLFRKKELELARKLHFGKKVIVLNNKIYSKIVYIIIYSQIAIYSKIRERGLQHPSSLLPPPSPLPPPKKKSPSCKVCIIE